MADFNGWPFDYEPDDVTPQETTEDDFRWSLAAATQSGYDDEYAGKLAASASGDSVILGTGRGIANGYGFENPAEQAVPVPANASSLARQYRLVARLDVAARRIYPHVLIGGAAASPQLPSLSRTALLWDEPLWKFRRAGGGSITSLVREAAAIRPDGHRVCTSDTRPPGRVGATIYESDTGRLRYFHDGSWKAFHDPSIPGALTPIPLSSSYESYDSEGGTPSAELIAPGRVALTGTFARKGGEKIVDGAIIGRVPAGLRPKSYVRFICAAEMQGVGAQRAAYVRITVASVNAQAYSPGQIVVHRIDGYTPEWAYLDGIQYRI